MKEVLSISNDRQRIDITNFGGRVMQWIVDGVDIVLGFHSVEEYQVAKEPYHSALIGRYSNRIANAHYNYQRKSYPLNKNHGDHILHGGSSAFHNVFWNIISKSNTHVEMQHISPDGDQGFPGELITTARYQLENQDTLRLTVEATTSKATPISITHHPYFNLSGLQSSDLGSHLFKIYSNEILSTNGDGIPTGNKVGVGYTGFDFTEWRSLSDALKESHSQIDLIGGIDHTYISNVKAKSLQLQAEAKSIESEVHMQVFSNQPGLQFYTANHFDGKEKGKAERPHVFRGAFCFEPQQWPDSPNQTSFPSVILRPNEIFEFVTEYKFPS